MKFKSKRSDKWNFLINRINGKHFSIRALKWLYHSFMKTTVKYRQWYNTFTLIRPLLYLQKHILWTCGEGILQGTLDQGGWRNYLPYSLNLSLSLKQTLFGPIWIQSLVQIHDMNLFNYLDKKSTLNSTLGTLGVIP